MEEVLRIDADDALWERYVSAPIFRDGKMPDRLTDEAYLEFIRGIFGNFGPRISLTARVFQRLASCIPNCLSSRM